MKESNIELNDYLTPSAAFERILHYAKPHGRFQILTFLALALCGLFVGMHSVAAVFLSSIPPHFCLSEATKNFTLIDGIPFDIVTNNTYHNLTLPICEAYENFNVDNRLANDTYTTSSCSKWLYDQTVYKSTIVTEWNLVCNKRWLKSAEQSIFMAGVLFGGVIMSEVSDMYGRRIAVLISTVLFILSGTAISFSPNFVVFASLRFLTAFFAFGMFICGYVLVMEILGIKGRTWFGVLYQLSWGIGGSCLSILAYFFRDWRSLQLSISASSLVLMMYFWILDESPRWLLLHNKTDEAVIILRKIAKFNGGEFPDEKELEDLISSISKVSSKKKTMTEKLFSFIKSQGKLLRTPIIRRRSLIMFFSWLVVSLVYYGLVFATAKVKGTHFFLFITGVVNSFAVIATVFMLKLFGRRNSYCITFIVSGLSSMFLLAVPKDMVWLNLLLSSIGIFAVSSGFSIAFIFSAELVPTQMRNASVGTASMFARVGSMLSPLIADLLGDVNDAIPSIIFGIFSWIAAALTILLPETGNAHLPETVEEVEQSKK